MGASLCDGFRCLGVDNLPDSLYIHLRVSCTGSQCEETLHTALRDQVKVTRNL